MSAFVKIPSGDVVRYVNKQYMTEADWSMYMTARDEKITKTLGPLLKKSHEEKSNDGY